MQPVGQVTKLTQSGIGLALTKQAHDIGAKVLVADIKTTSDFDDFAAEKDDILYVQSDVTHWPDFTKMFDACEAKWNDVPDAYAICAGLFDPPFSNFWQDPEQDEGYKQVDVNVNHPIKLTRMALSKSLNKGKRASVCIIASIGGIAGIIASPLYCATKHAMVGFVKSMKDTEPLTAVKITTICPGGVATPLLDEQQKKQYSLTKDRLLTPEVCATHMLDLLQKKEYACGSVLEVTKLGHRLIPEWNVSPAGGHGVGEEDITAEFVENMLEPIKAKLQSERNHTVM
jgi:NAD(P)-dependent dehydrogenase (short-subunit alcohol dehydrogenase family)